MIINNKDIKEFGVALLDYSIENSEDLKSKTFPHFEMINSYLKDTLNLALAGTGWTIGYNDITKRRTVRISNKTPLEIIDEIRKVYRVEIFFNSINKKVNVYEQLGEDKGTFSWRI